MSRTEYNSHRTESAAKRDGDTPDYMDVNLGSILGMS